MQTLSQFERLADWLRGRFASVEQVEADQGSARALVATAEYELERLRAELAGVCLEEDDGVGQLTEPDGNSGGRYWD